MMTVESTGLAVFSEDAAYYYGSIARGGAGIVNTGHLGVDPRYYLGGHKEYFDFHSKQYINSRVIPPMHKITERIHVYGALASIELNHGGQWCSPKGNHPPIGPSDIIKEDGEKVQAMTEDDMEYVADCFAEAAFIGKRAGFDIVNVHAGHNWLLSEFFSPVENQRSDEYGGTVENRARFPKMVMDKIRTRVGDDMIIAMRISGSELQEGGITIEDVAEIANIMSQTVDLIQLTTGKIHDSLTEAFTFPSQYMQEGCNTYLAKAVKKNAKCLIETIGGINSPELADQLIKSGVADFVGMARSFVADPDWGEKAKQGKSDDIRPCIRCLHCLDFCEPLDASRSISYCSVNPRRVFTVQPDSILGSENKKNVAVIGGGPAGMVAAMEIADKGHKVTLFEKSSKLGGRLEFSDFLMFKDGVTKYREYLINQIKKRPAITVALNCEGTPENIAVLKPDAIIIAAGAQKFVPNIKGSDNDIVVHAADIIGSADKLGNKLVVVGGGEVGCELTIQFQTMGKHVDLIEVQDKLMKDSKGFWEGKEFTEFFLTHEYKSGMRTFVGVKSIDRVNIHLSSKCTEICDHGVWMEDNKGNREFIEADNVILSTGLRNNLGYANDFTGISDTIISIGDFKEVSNIENASRTGYSASFCV